jgi:hypothetical protein
VILSNCTAKKEAVTDRQDVSRKRRFLAIAGSCNRPVAAKRAKMPHSESPHARCGVGQGVIDISEMFQRIPANALAVATHDDSGLWGTQTDGAWIE